MSRDKATAIVCAAIAVASLLPMMGITYFVGTFGVPMKPTFCIVLAVFCLIMGNYVKQIEARIDDLTEGRSPLWFNDPEFAVCVIFTVIYFGIAAGVVYIGHRFSIERYYTLTVLGIMLLAVILLPGSVVNKWAKKLERKEDE